MRRVLLVLSLSALALGCSGAKPTGPAWPAPSTTAEDGGESIEPRSTSVATAIEKSADPEPSADDEPAAEDAKPEAKPAEADDKAEAEAAAGTSLDDENVMMTEEIIIEVEDEE